MFQARDYANCQGIDEKDKWLQCAPVCSFTPNGVHTIWQEIHGNGHQTGVMKGTTEFHLPKIFSGRWVGNTRFYAEALGTTFLLTFVWLNASIMIRWGVVVVAFGVCRALRVDGRQGLSPCFFFPEHGKPYL